MNTEARAGETFEISSRFRKSVEERIARLERDADWDEQTLAMLDHEDHARRHLRLVVVQRTEALRMRLFLDRSRTRLPRPLIEI
jgi:ribosome-associated translation inhibitor RaiA